MNDYEFLTEVRRLARDGSRVVILEHARIRNPAQGKYPISDRAIRNCILHASAKVTERPAPDIREPNGWKGRITRSEAGLKTEVACVVVPARRLVIITAYEQKLLTRAPRRLPGSADTGDDTDEENGRRQ